MNGTFGNEENDDNEDNCIQDEFHNFSTSRLNILASDQQNEEEMKNLNVINENHFTDDSHISFQSSSGSLKTKEFVCTSCVKD